MGKIDPDLLPAFNWHKTVPLKTVDQNGLFNIQNYILNYWYKCVFKYKLTF